MSKRILFALISIHSTAYADTWSADSFGNTTGRIGGERLHTYSDSLGNTTGVSIAAKMHTLERFENA